MGVAHSFNYPVRVVGMRLADALVYLFIFMTELHQ